RGRASLNTGGGDIDVSDCDLSGNISTGGGTVRLSRVKGGLRGSSGSGPVIYVDKDGRSTRHDNNDEDDGETGVTISDDETGDLTNVTIDDDGIHISSDSDDDNGSVHR